jgi:hypothetical protein
LTFIDDVTLAKLHPNRSRAEQVSNGLRLGMSLGAFLIAGILLGKGLPRVTLLVSPYHLIWSDWAGWLEVSLACVLLFATAGIWVLLVAAIAFRGFVAGILILLTGSGLHHGQHVPRFQGVELVFFSLATLVPIFRFANTRPTILDRVALTFYAVSFIWYLESAASHSMDLPFVAGLIPLVISWCVYRWKATKPRSQDKLPS